MRLSRGGVPAAADDGTSRSEVLVALPGTSLTKLRPRAGRLIAVGAPGAALFAEGADDVVVPGEPETLFRRIRVELERLDLVARLERMDQKVAALERALADAAHDVRSPLQAVIGNAELLSADESLTQRQRQSAQAAVRQANRALQLAEKILEDARGRDRSALEVGPVGLGELVENAVAQAEAHARSRGVAVVAVPPARPVELRGDADLLGRLLDNLIANAVHVSPRGSTVEVAAWRDSPKSVCLSVRDSGEGIAEADLPRLVAGLGPGRGLRISRDIAERHGGELWAESRISEGSRFFVSLPLQPPSSRPRVLLVSDDANWVREVTRTLRAACDVRSATLAGARLGHKRTDLVLVEAQERPPKGARALDALRTAAKGALVPVIELPSHSAAERLARTLAHLAP